MSEHEAFPFPRCGVHPEEKREGNGIGPSVSHYRHPAVSAGVIPQVRPLKGIRADAAVGEDGLDAPGDSVVEGPEALSACEALPPVLGAEGDLWPG